MTQNKLEVLLSIAIVAALMTLGLSLAFYSQLLILFGVLLLTVQALCLTLVVAGGVWLAWFSGDRSIALLLRLEELRQAKETTEQMRAQALVIHSQAALNHANAIASSTIIKEVTQNKALFMLHQGETRYIPALTPEPVMLQAPPEDVIQQPIDPIAMLVAALHLMVIGFTEGGKTTLIHYLGSLWAKIQCVMVLDYDYANGMWEGCEVYTDPETFSEKLSTEFGRRNMLRQSGQQTKFEPIRVVIDEYSAAAKNKQVSSIIELLIRRGRKYNMRVIIGVQDNQVETLGWKGNGELRSNFAYTVEAKLDPTTRQRTLTMKPNQGVSTTVLTPDLPDAEACIKPLVPAVPAVSGDENAVPDAVPTSSLAVPVPNAVPTISVQERMTEQAKLLYKERDLDIALCIIQGMNKTATREKVGGKNETTGKRYDEIYAELQPVYFNVKDLKTGGEQS